LSIGSSYLLFFLSLSQAANPYFIEVDGRLQTDFKRDKISHVVRDTAEVSKGWMGLAYPSDCRRVLAGPGACALPNTLRLLFWGDCESPKEPKLPQSCSATWAIMKFVAPGIKDHSVAKARPLFLQIRVELDCRDKGEPWRFWLAVPGCLKQAGMTLPAETPTHSQPSPLWGGAASLSSDTGAVPQSIFPVLHPIPSYHLWQLRALSIQVSVLT